MSTCKKIGIGLVTLGIVLFLIGFSIGGEPENRSYHKVWKDNSGTWQGQDVTYLSDGVHPASMWGVVIGVAGGIMIAIGREPDKH